MLDQTEIKMKAKMIGIVVLLGISLLGMANIAIAGQDTLLAVAARTATTNTADRVKYKETGIHVIVRVTAVPGGDTITPKIQGKDYSGNYYDLLVGSAISTTGINVLKLAPGIAPLANAAAADLVPTVYRVVITHSAGTSFTYGVNLETQ